MEHGDTCGLPESSLGEAPLGKPFMNPTPRAEGDGRPDPRMSSRTAKLTDALAGLRRIVGQEPREQVRIHPRPNYFRAITSPPQRPNEPHSPPFLSPLGVNPFPRSPLAGPHRAAGAQWWGCERSGERVLRSRSHNRASPGVQSPRRSRRCHPSRAAGAAARWHCRLGHVPRGHRPRLRAAGADRSGHDARPGPGGRGAGRRLSSSTAARAAIRARLPRTGSAAQPPLHATAAADDSRGALVAVLRRMYAPPPLPRVRSPVASPPAHHPNCDRVWAAQTATTAATAWTPSSAARWASWGAC